ncbi:phosphodiesterase [Frigidibacter sp. ROC022]|uniref:phosphodiesterase n=1 Tax=Frigidibacter sp. ROC022 TaxID=2971796 RepID=UPI00215A0E1B|nr:phosphodiesterase [Frigidibacter sp. ROC022]
MTAILQLSDTHVVPRGELVSGRLDTVAALSRLVERITDIRDQIGPVDALLVTGDLTDDGRDKSYEQFKSLVAPLGLPTHVLTGNHDAREPMRAAFAETMPEFGPLNWTHRVGDVQMIGLDTLVEGQGAGRLGEESLDFLRETLSQAAGAPVLLGLHHPPFFTGIGFMDKIGLTDRDALCEILSDYRGPLRILCGHIHRMMVSDLAGHVAISAPAPASLFAFDRRPEAPVGFLRQEGGCLLHRWNGQFQTVTIEPVAGSGPFPF